MVFSKIFEIITTERQNTGKKYASFIWRWHFVSVFYRCCCM